MTTVKGKNVQTTGTSNSPPGIHGYARVSRNLVVDSAMAQIKTMIIQGELTAYQKLPPERDLAVLLGVSRPTLREALRALAALNIVESRHGEGTFVTSLHPELLAEPIDFVLQLDETLVGSLLEARLILEVGAAGFAATRATLEEVERLEAIAREHATCEDDMAACIALDIEFHSLVVRAARNPILTSLHATVTALSRAGRERTAKLPETRKRTTGELAAIATAIRERDQSRAREAMRAHLGHVAAGLHHA